MNETEQQHTLLDEYDIASHTALPLEEARAMLILTGHAYECNGIYYVMTDKVPLEDFDKALRKEASAFSKKSKVLDFIDENQGCRRKDIQEFLTVGEYKPSYDAIELILNILTEEDAGVYEEDDDTLYSI
jgi:hypothetical protein